MRLPSLLLTLGLCSVVFLTTITIAAEEGHEAPAQKCGVELGIVAFISEDRSRFGIKTREGLPRTYAPRGAMGRFDPEMLGAIGRLTVGDKVEVAWEWEERYRVVKLRVLGHGDGPAQPGLKPECHDRPLPQAIACDLAPAQPKQSCGLARGVVTGVDPKGRFTIKGESGEEQAYVPRWVGGLPDEGGHFDGDTVGVISSLRVGQRVEVQWEWEERPRCTKVAVVGN